MIVMQLSSTLFLDTYVVQLVAGYHSASGLRSLGFDSGTVRVASQVITGSEYYGSG